MKKITLEFTPHEIEVLSHALICYGGRCNDKAVVSLKGGDKFVAFLHKMDAEEVFDMAGNLPDARESDDDRKAYSRALYEKYNSFGDAYIHAIEVLDKATAH